MWLGTTSLSIGTESEDKLNIKTYRELYITLVKKTMKMQQSG